MHILLALVVAVSIVLGIRALLVYRSVATYRDYWNNTAAGNIPAGSFVYVALGDSAAQGVGATTPMKGYVGLVAKHVAAKTGRPVHIINLSVTGARVQDAIEDQLPRLKALSVKPNLITIDIGSNDVNKKDFDAQSFAEQLDTLARQLPKGTFIAEISPYFKEYEPVANRYIHDSAKKYGLVVAPLSDILRRNKSWRNSSGDFFHPSNHGYELWARGFITVIEPTL